MTIQVEAPELTAAIRDLIQAISSNPPDSSSSSRTTQAPVDTPAADMSPADAPAADTTPAADAPPFDVAPSLEEVRAALTQLTRNGKQPEAKALLAAIGYTKLTDVPKEHYAELLTAAKEKL